MEGIEELGREKGRAKAAVSLPRPLSDAQKVTIPKVTRARVYEQQISARGPRSFVSATSQSRCGWPAPHPSHACPTCAYSAAMKAPWLVPPTQSSGTPASSSAVSTPRCARPRLPPPHSTMPTALPAIMRASLLRQGGRGAGERPSTAAVTDQHGGLGAAETFTQVSETAEGACGQTRQRAASTCRVKQQTVASFRQCRTRRPGQVSSSPGSHFWAPPPYLCTSPCLPSRTWWWRDRLGRAASQSAVPAGGSAPPPGGSGCSTTSSTRRSMAAEEAPNSAASCCW